MENPLDVYYQEISAKYKFEMAILDKQIQALRELTEFMNEENKILEEEVRGWNHAS